MAAKPLHACMQSVMRPAAYVATSHSRESPVGLARLPVGEKGAESRKKRACLHEADYSVDYSDAGNLITKETIMTKKKHYQSISKRLPIMISISFLILLAVVVIITYFREENRMIDEYHRMADGVTNLMIEALDTEKLDYYIEENYSSREYLDIMKFYYELKDNYPDVYYMYVYSFYKDEVPSGTIIFDLEDEYTENPNQDSIDWVGSTYIILEPFASLIDELIGSKEPVFDTAFSEEDGYLLSFAKPIFDAEGNYLASACVDFSMEEMHRQNIRFILILSAILIVVGFGILLLLSNFELKRTVTRPLLAIGSYR